MGADYKDVAIGMENSLGGFMVEIRSPPNVMLRKS